MAAPKRKGIGSGGVGTKGNIQVSAQTRKLSKKHHRDDVRFNLSHAKDHLKQAAVSAKKMHVYGEKTRVSPQFSNILSSIRGAKS
jgi:hypothetical protein